MRACQRIKEGQEILVSYYIFSDLPSRQEKLLTSRFDLIYLIDIWYIRNPSIRQERLAEIQNDRHFQCRLILKQSYVGDKVKPNFHLNQTNLQVWVVFVVRRGSERRRTDPTPNPRVDRRDWDGERPCWSFEESRVEVGADGKYPRQGHPQVCHLQLSDFKFLCFSKFPWPSLLLPRFPQHLLTCYRLAYLANCSKKMEKFKAKIFDVTLTLGYNYHKYYTDLIDEY